MAKNGRYSNALHISLPVPAGTKSGDPVKVGRICGVAQIDRKADGTATVWLDRSWNIDVDGAVTAVGAQVFITLADNTLHGVTAAGREPWGVALEVKGAGVGVLEVVPFGYVSAASA